MKNLLRSLLPLLLLGLLAGCSVYENVVHPRRLPTPDMTPQAKAKYKAAEKARHKGMVLKTEEVTTGVTDPNAPTGSEAKKDGKLSYNELPEGTKVKYDKEGLIRNKPNLKRRQYHRYDTRPLTHNDVNRENRKLRKSSGKGKGKTDDGDAPGLKTRADQPVEDAGGPPPPPPKKKKNPTQKRRRKRRRKRRCPSPTPRWSRTGTKAPAVRFGQLRVDKAPPVFISLSHPL